jgi:hypothetical protein
LYRAGSIPPEVYSVFEQNGGSDSKVKVMMRLELTKSEFERPTKMFETREQCVKAKALPNSNPYLEFLTKTAQSPQSVRRMSHPHKPDTSKPNDSHHQA